MNATLLTADRNTHIKIVAMGLSAAFMIALTALLRALSLRSAEFDIAVDFVSEADLADGEHHLRLTVSLPLNRPSATAARMAFSISCCEVTPTTLRNCAATC